MAHSNGPFNHSQVAEVVRFIGLKINSLLFADDVVLSALLNHHLQLTLGQSAAKCKGAEMRINTSKYEAMVLNHKRVLSTPRSQGRFAAKWKSSSISGLLSFTSEGKLEQEIDRLGQ